MKQKPKALSRKVRAEMTKDLAKRLEDYAYVLDAIIHSNVPNLQHIVVEYRVRVIFNILLNSQLKQLREIEGLAKLIAERT